MDLLSLEYAKRYEINEEEKKEIANKKCQYSVNKLQKNSIC